MAKSFAEALVRAGRVRPDETPEAQREESWRARQKREAEEIAARLEEPARTIEWEPAATGRIVEGAEAGTAAPPIVCSECGEPFDPDAPEHKPFGRSDQCGPCAQAADTGPRRKRGQMVWTHKTAPVLEIEGGQALTADELAAMRRR